MEKQTTPDQQGHPEKQWVFLLYISGSTLASKNAIDNLGRICRTHLDGRYRIEVIDLGQAPERAIKDQIIATPALIRKSPTPQCKIIGDLSQTEKVLACMEIRSAEQC